ncbi:MAG: hypothetical protein Q4P32_04465 [Micrococcales bacterium]|nr:hypothetical protein [Micrococcales bacterium]
MTSSASAAGRAPRRSLARRPWRAWVTASAGLGATVLALALLSGRWSFVAAMAVAMLLIAVGWVLLLGLPSPRGTTAVLAGAGVILLGSSVLSQELRESLLPGAVALAMIVEFIHQLARRDGRPRLVESVSASITGIALLTSGASVLLLAESPEGVAGGVVVFGAVALASLADLGLRYGSGGPISGVVALILGAVGAGVLGAAFGIALPVWFVAAAGALAGGSSYALRQAQSVLPTLFGRRAQLASGVASVLATGVLAYALTWLTPGWPHGLS